MSNQFYKKGQFLKEMLKDTYAFFKTRQHIRTFKLYRPKDLRRTFKEVLKRAKKKDIPLDFPSIFNIKSTEFSLQKVSFNGKNHLALAVCGSNDVIDWVLNVDLRCLPVWDAKDKKVRWFKWHGVMEARRIIKVLRKVDTNKLPLITIVHSKSGATAPPLIIMLRKAGIMNDKTFRFAPVPCVTKTYRVANMVDFINRKDIVPNLGKPILVQPKCPKIYHKGGNDDVHSLGSWDYYFEEGIERQIEHSTGWGR